MENYSGKIVRVLFYVQDTFENPHYWRKSHIGYMTRSAYEVAVKQNRPVFELGSDYLNEAKRMPETTTL